MRTINSARPPKTRFFGPEKSLFGPPKPKMLMPPADGKNAKNAKSHFFKTGRVKPAAETVGFLYYM